MDEPGQTRERSHGNLVVGVEVGVVAPAHIFLHASSTGFWLAFYVATERHHLNVFMCSMEGGMVRLHLPVNDPQARKYLEVLPSMHCD